MDYYVVVDHSFFICIFLLDICMKDPSSLKNESLKGRVLSLRNRTAGPDEDGKMLTCDKCGRAIMYRSNQSFNMPPPGIPRAFDTFAVLGRREFDYQSLPVGGEFDPYALGVGNLNCTLDVM